MAHTRRSRVIDYPYSGSFYKMGAINTALPLDQRDITDVLVLQTVCDIQEVSKAANPVLVATFSVFFPYDATQTVPVSRGMKFVGSMGGVDVSGIVTNVVLSQLGGIVAYVRDYDTDTQTV